MERQRDIQLSECVDVNDPASALRECRALWYERWPEAGFSPVAALFDSVHAVFRGAYPGYHACDTDYHDLHHTLAVFAASARLLDGWSEDRGQPPAFDLATDVLCAALLHDVGYIRKRGEEGGTGARFTKTHVMRSADFVAVHARDLGLARPRRVARLIWSTGLAGEYDEQAWESDDERLAGALLASADLVGQMSDRAYLERLLFLYYEFREAGFPGYETEFDILRKTLDFYQLTVRRLDESLGGMRAHARAHFRLRRGLDRDLYAEAMERQMDYLKGILADNSTNFRHKLRRMDLENVRPRVAVS